MCFFSYIEIQLCIGNDCVPHNGTEYSDTPVDCQDVRMPPQSTVHTWKRLWFLIGFLCISIELFLRLNFTAKQYHFYLSRHYKYKKTKIEFKKKKRSFYFQLLQLRRSNITYISNQVQCLIKREFNQPSLKLIR